MKKLLIAFLLLLNVSAGAQTNIVAADGTSFSINGKVFNRGTVVVDTPVNSTGMSIMSPDLKSVICYMTPYTNYKRQGGVAFASRKAFLAFADSFMFTASGGGAPSGAAGGDLTGTYPSPTIGKYYTFTGLIETDGGEEYTFTIPSGYTKCIGITPHCTSGASAGDRPIIYDVNISGTSMTVAIIGLSGSPIGRNYNISAILSK